MTPWRKFTEPLLNGQRLCAVILLLLQNLLLWRLMEGALFAGICSLLAIAALFSQPERLLPPLRFDRIAWVLAILMLMKWRLAPHHISEDNAFIHSEFTYEIICLLATYQLVLLWLANYRERLPVWFSALGGLGLVFLGNIRVNDPERTLYGACVAVAVTMMVLIATGSRRNAAGIRPLRNDYRLYICLAPLLLGIALGQAGASLLAHHERRLEELFSDYFDGRERDVSSGFSGEAGLESISLWSQYDAELPMLRIQGTNQATYFRGCAFHLFEHNRWQVGLTSRPLTEVTSAELEIYAQSDEACYRLKSSQPSTSEVGVVLDIWPEIGAGGRYFLLPHESNCLITRPSNYQYDDAGNVTRSAETPEQHYRVLIPDSEPKVLLTPAERELCLFLPDPLDARITATADALFLDCPTSSAKIISVEQFFQSNFEYDLGVRIPRGEDRMGYFLEHRLAAHCEYFASATTILLRKAGVPARFVTGYVAGEYNSSGRFWVARRGDAHAWVEAYDEELQRWVIVESTPAEGIPSQRTVQGISAWQQALQLLGIQCVDFLRRLTLTTILERLGVAVLIAGSFAAVAFIIYRGYPMLLFTRVQQPTSAVSRELLAERIALDRLVKAKGMTRAPHETLHQFANRIHSQFPDNWGLAAAECYRLYATARFAAPAPELLMQVQLRRSSLK